MSGPVKIVLAVFGVLISLLVVVIVLIKLEITPERVRTTLIPLAEEKLQRKVEVGEINIGIFSRVSLDNLKVMQSDGSDEFISARSMSLSYKLWPLLTGRVLVDEVRLDQPRIVVIRNPDGSFNFNDLLQQQPDNASSEEIAENSSSKTQESDSDNLINLLVNEVVVSNGELLFIDRQQSSKSPYRYSLNQLNLQAKQITFDKSFPISLSALLNGSKIELSGEYDIGKMAGDFDLQLAPLDLIQFAPYYRDALPGDLGSAILAVNLEAALTADSVSSKGKVSLNNLDVVFNELPDTAFNQTDLLVEYAIKYHMDRQSLDISTLLVDLNGIALGAEGEIQLGGAEPELAATLLLEKFDLHKLSQGLPSGLTTEWKKFSLTGLVDGKIDLAGRSSDGMKLLKSASFDLDQVAANVAGSRAGISGSVRYAEQVAQADKLELTFADQPVQLSFTATDLLEDLIRGEFAIEADSLDLNRIIPASEEGVAAGETSASSSAGTKMPPVERQKSIAEDIGPFDIPVEMKGSLAVNQLLYQQLVMNKVQADLLLKGNHLIVSKLRSDIGGGELQIASDINLEVKGLAYTGQVNLSQSNLTALVSGLFPLAKQSVSGLLHWQNNFSGRGTIPENLLDQLQVKGAVRIGKGKVTGSPLLEQLSSFLDSTDLKVLSFEEFSGNYDLRNGVAQLAADLDSSKAKLRPQGTVGLDGALDLNLDARLAPTLLDNLGANKNLKKVMTDAEGWGVFPLRIKGTINQPKIGFDSKQLQQLATERATQEVTDQLMKKLGGDQAVEQTPIKQLLDGTLNKLFGN